MDKKDKLIQIKTRLLALGLASVVIGTAGCSSSKNKDEEPSRVTISQKYNNFENYYKYVIQNGESKKVYNSQNVYLLFNKETYEVKEYIFKSHVTFLGGAELYDLETEELLVYGNGTMVTTYNEQFFKYLIENNYQVCLNDVEDYIEGHNAKDYYSLDEIKELEPLIVESLKIINNAMTRTK